MLVHAAAPAVFKCSDLEDLSEQFAFVVLSYHTQHVEPDVNLDSQAQGKTIPGKKMTIKTFMKFC